MGKKRKNISSDEKDCQADSAAEPPAPKKMMKTPGAKRLIVVLENAQLETGRVGKLFELLSADKHGTFLRKNGKDPTVFRPDITHQCLLMLLDSPLNRAGLLQVYIHTAKNVLIEVHPQTRIPRTFDRFCGLMVQLLHKLSIHASDGPQKLLKVIKNPLTDHLPAGCRKICTSFKADRCVNAKELVPAKSAESGDSTPILIVVGAMAHGSLNLDYTEEDVAVSGYPLSAALTCAKLCCAFEEKNFKKDCKTLEMEVDTAGASTSQNMTNGTNGESSVMAPAGAVGAQGSVSVAIHPLVIMNVSEHWTRQRAQEGKPMQVIGALIGKQKGRSIEIFNTFELKFDRINDCLIIDRDFYTVREEQFKQVFQDLDFLGWYSTGGAPNESDIAVHKQICDINESPIFLKLNPASKHTDLPITVFESVIDIVEGKATMLFVEIPFTLATEDSERIGVDHVARVSTVSSSSTDGGTDAKNVGPSVVADHLTAQYSAIKMLHSRVKLIMDYVKAVDEGTLVGNHEILRDIKSLVHRLPLMDNPQFESDFAIQCNDVALMAYLGSITKGCNTINQFVNKFNTLYDRQGMGRRMRGLFF